ncbi:MAG: hypothetical protein EBQ96_02905 [Proteobacteria bacterium]|nr:hypothetical protein [Pseudomonadota bacterium]
MEQFSYPRLQITEYAEQKLGAILNPLQENWLKELHYILSTKWLETEGMPPVCPHTTASLMCLSIVSGVSSTLYKPAEYRETGCAKKHFEGVLTEFYPWELDTPKGITREDAVKALYKTLRNPAAHSLNIRFKKNGNAQPVSFLLPHIESNEGLSQRIIKPKHDFGSNSIEMSAEDTLEFAPTTFYWGIRKMIEKMIDTEEKINEIFEGLKNRTLTK